MENAGLIVVLVTASTRSEAEQIAEVLLEKHEAACVNMVSGVFSRFWWQGKIESADEVMLIIKTSSSVVENVIETVKKVHSYTVPEIIVLPIIAGNPDYLSWIKSEVKK